MNNTGYSVFAVCQADPRQPLVLARTDADMVAHTLSGPDTSMPQAARIGRGEGSGANVRVKDENDIGKNRGNVVDEEDDDWQLQAALQASLMNGAEIDEEAFKDYRESITSDSSTGAGASGAGWSTGNSVNNAGEEEEAIAASLARNRLLMEEMRRQQEAALRMTLEEEVAQFGRNGSRDESVLYRRRELDGRDTPTPVPARDDDVEEEEEEEEDEELQAALRASLESTSDPNINRVTEKEEEAEVAVDMEEMRRRRLAKFGG